MTNEEQIKFVKDICGSLTDALLNQMDSIPENWDGFELRQWIADYYAIHFNYKPMNGRTKRMKDYKNDVIINNLT